MKKHTKKINDYLCEVEINNDLDPSTQGWISNGNCSGSMQSAADQGYITTACGEHLHKIPDSILHRIEEWACSVGY